MPGPPIVQQITFLDTDDLARTAAFYEGILGLRLARDQGVCRIYHVCGGAYLGFCTQGAASGSTGLGRVGPGATVITLITDEVDEWFRRLEAAGVEIVKRPADNATHHIYNAFVRDPNGYLVEIQRFWEPLA